MIKDGDLVLATHGRSFWVLDDVSLLRQLTPATMTDAVKLFEPRTPCASAAAPPWPVNFAGAANIDGVNPPTGVVVPFFLKDKPAAPVDPDHLRDSAPGAGGAHHHLRPGGHGAGRRRSAPPVARAGANTYVWDMRYPGPTLLPDAVMQGRAQGPLAPPGTYTLDPRRQRHAGDAPRRRSSRTRGSPTRDADLETQFSFLMTTRDKLTETMAVVKKVRDTRAEAEALVKKAKEKSAAAARGRRPARQVDGRARTTGSTPSRSAWCSTRAKAGRT